MYVRIWSVASAGYTGAIVPLALLASYLSLSASITIAALLDNSTCKLQCTLFLKLGSHYIFTAPSKTFLSLLKQEIFIDE